MGRFGCLTSCYRRHKYTLWVAGAAATGRESAAVAAGAAACAGTAPRSFIFISSPCGRCRCRGARGYSCSYPCPVAGAAAAGREGIHIHIFTLWQVPLPRGASALQWLQGQPLARALLPRVYFSPRRSSAPATAGGAGAGAGAGARTHILRCLEAAGWRPGRWRATAPGLMQAVWPGCLCLPVAWLCWSAQDICTMGSVPARVHSSDHGPAPAAACAKH